MRIALFGGTFNPVHVGHLVSAVDVHSHFMLDEVILIPLGIPPHKKDNMVDAELRYKMVELAVKDFPFLKVSRFEIDRNTVSYAVDTVRHFTAEHIGDEVFYIIGVDAFYHIEMWKDFEAIRNMVSFIVLSRPHYNIERTLLKYKKYFVFVVADRRDKYTAEPGTVYIFDSLYLDVSSSEIRRRIKEGKNIKHLVPHEVAEFITREGIYRI